jgi:2-polyprenyl-3-methyl-5-hydroxy-6-metoxy-1,4-benzoquinol methylase
MPAFRNAFTSASTRLSATRARTGSIRAEYEISSNDAAALWREASAMQEFCRDILLSVMPLTLNGIRVLDSGCGEGLLTRAVTAPDADAVGVDPTPR